MEKIIHNNKIYYEVIGSGTPLLMLHGFTVDHRIMKGCMEPLFEIIDKPYKRIYFDMPGMGKTLSNPNITNADTLLDLIIKFIDEIIQEEHYLIVGESFGAYLARGIIKKKPSHVNGLLLICPLIFPDIQQRELPVFQIIEEDEKFMESLATEERDEFRHSSMVILNRRIWERYNNEIVPALKCADSEYLTRFRNGGYSFSFGVDALDKPFMKPSLIVTGRQDRDVGYRDVWKIIENFPRASFVVLDKAGHNLQIEQNVLFNEAVKEWLSRV